MRSHPLKQIAIYGYSARVYDYNHVAKYAIFAYFRAIWRVFSMFVGKYTATQLDALKTPIFAH